ncbi:MAG TPA: PaaI family thioesterase [Actinomycetes bacterium]|nr:PaaI family thioesterase [Actinomycetes bacterium]
MPEGSGAGRAAEPDVDPAAGGEFLRSVGLHVDLLTGTEVRAHLDASKEHHTPWGIVHGGLYTTVIETAASIGASYAARPDGKFAVGVNNQTDFLRPHVAGRLDVRATPIQQGRRLQLWLVEITNGEGRTVARGQVRLMNQPLPAAGAR